jgi:hypothetical protein
MSPGVTFERVYRELKRRLADGTLRPGMPIEPAQMSAELAASITPIREALHRLAGERLVEAPNHNGFRVPRRTEAELRDLYLWNGHLLRLAVRHMRAEALGDIAAPGPDTGKVAAATAGLFHQIARATGSEEHAHAIAQLNDRLASCRRLEPNVLDGTAEELGTIGALLRNGERAQLSRALIRYHQRRAAAAPAILAMAIATG